MWSQHILTNRKYIPLLPVQATVYVYPWSLESCLLLLHTLLLLLPFFWPRPAGTPEETAGNPHRPSPILSYPIPDHQIPRTPANHKKH